MKKLLILILLFSPTIAFANAQIIIVDKIYGKSETIKLGENEIVSLDNLKIKFEECLNSKEAKFVIWQKKEIVNPQENKSAFVQQKVFDDNLKKTFPIKDFTAHKRYNLALKNCSN